MKNTILSLAILFTCLTQAQQIDQPQPVHIEVTGSGTPVLFIPGFTVPGESWDSIVGQLEKNHECHILSLAGFGGKVETPDMVYHLRRIELSTLKTNAKA